MMYVSRPRFDGAEEEGCVADRNTQVFLNIVLDEAVEEKEGGEKVRLGMIVRLSHLPHHPWLG